MIYLTDADLTDSAYQRFIDESKGDATAGSNVIDNNEKKAIGMVKTYMTGRYDVDKIFKVGEVVRDELLAEIIAKITLYKLFGRNAGRKVSSDVKDDYDWALEELRRINSGRTILAGLPKPQDENGDDDITNMYGNNTNENFYI